MENGFFSGLKNGRNGTGLRLKSGFTALPLRSMWLLVLGLAPICVPATASGADYYVGKDGSDSNSCTQAQSAGSPKWSISAGVRCLRSGDTLFVKQGDYAEQVSLNSSTIQNGTSWSNATTIKAVSGDRVTVKSSGSNWCIRIHSNREYLIIDGINCDGSGSTNDGIKIEDSSNHIRLTNLEVYNAGKQGILDVSRAAIHGNGGYNEFLNISSHHNGTDGRYDHGFYIKGSNNKFWNNLAYNNASFGVHFYCGDCSTNNNDIQFNKAYNNNRLAPFDAGNGILVDGSGNIVANNIVHGNFRGLDCFSGSNNKFYNNTVVDNDYGYRTRSSCSSAQFRNNIFWSNGTLRANFGSGTVDSENLTTNPNFVDAPRYDFHLTSGSPARDLGQTLPEVTIDFEGTPRETSDGKIDAGAYEFAANSSVEPADTQPKPPGDMQIVQSD